MLYLGCAPRNLLDRLDVGGDQPESAGRPGHRRDLGDAARGQRGRHGGGGSGGRLGRGRRTVQEGATDLAGLLGSVRIIPLSDLVNLLIDCL